EATTGPMPSQKVPPVESVGLPQWTIVEVSRLTGPCTSNHVVPPSVDIWSVACTFVTRETGNAVIGSGSVSVNEYFLFHVVLPPVFDRKLSPAMKPQNCTSTGPPPVPAHV